MSEIGVDVITERIKGLTDLINERFRDQGEKLDGLVIQTMKTNGRVGKLEVWRGLILGGLIIVNIVVVPLFFLMINHITK